MRRSARAIQPVPLRARNRLPFAESRLGRRVLGRPFYKARWGSLFKHALQIFFGRGSLHLGFQPGAAFRCLFNEARTRCLVDDLLHRVVAPLNARRRFRGLNVLSTGREAEAGRDDGEGNLHVNHLQCLSLPL